MQSQTFKFPGRIFVLRIFNRNFIHQIKIPTIDAVFCKTTKSLRTVRGSNQTGQFAGFEIASCTKPSINSETEKLTIPRFHMMVKVRNVNYSILLLLSQRFSPNTHLKNC